MRTGGGSRIGILLLTIVLLLGAASSAQAQDCSDFGGVLDGFAGDIPPSQLQIDQNCTIRNYPASNPLNTNFSFFTQPGQNPDRWLIVFDNVVHTGQMSCNSVLEHKIWFTNGSSSSIQEGCQNLLIPVEKIDKQNPAGQTTAAIGVPFTYTLTMPVLFDSATGTVINTSGSLNDLHGITVTDDLGATGADLTYVSHVAYWESSGTPVAHTFSNVGGLLTFDAFPIVPAGEQIILELTVVLEDTPANAPGTQFINTAKWDFGRLIDGVFYEPLPGEWGITPPLTIAAPELVVTKTGPATLGRTLNLGEWGQFAIDVQNTGLGPAWDVTILDRLPDGATGGMCDTTPEVLSAQVFEADGTTPVSGALVEGTDFSLAYVGAPTCELTLSMLTAAGAIGPTERLIISYRTRLDADSQDGATLTNVVGAVEWFNGDASNPDRISSTRTLTDGTVGVLDHQDAHTVTVALFGYFFEKSVENLTSGASPTATAAPGDTLRYTLRLQTTDVALDDLTFQDDLGVLNATPVFVPGTLALVAGSIPAGADISNTDPNGGTNGAGLLDIRNLSLPANSEIRIQFDITLESALLDGVVVTNQADLVRTGTKIADSDDPNVNGQADPSVVGDEDPTQVLIATVPAGPLRKENTQATASVGETFSYRITVPETPHRFDLYDVRITDDLTASAADLRFLDVTRIAGSGPWTPVNTGTATNLVIEDPIVGIDIPAGEQIVVEITVVLEDTPTNVAGLTFTNTASFVYDTVDGDDTSQQSGDPGTTEPMTVVEPELTLTKSGPATMTIGTPETFTLDVQNVGDSPAWNATLTDLLPDTPSGGTCDTAPAAVTAQVFEADGTTPVSAVLVEGTDYSTSYSGAPGCLFRIDILAGSGTIGPGQRLIVSYETQLDADTQDGVALTNIAGAVQWFSLDDSSPDRRTHTEVVTNGTVGTLDHEDAHTVNTALPGLLFEKTVVNVTSGADPATTATPGDVLRYRLRVENLAGVPLDDFALVDDLGSLNATPVFEPGSLTLVPSTIPAGADTTGTDPNGGSNGTGLVDIRGLSLPALNDSVAIEFEITLAAVIPNGTLVTNQTQLRIDDSPFLLSDDPNVNGPADPDVSGDEDPTQVRIESAPAFRVEKISSYVTGDPTVLLAGETLRYTITVANLGADTAVDVTIRDAIPANTAYVPGSTTLNGAPVADGAGGIAPLATGILLNAPSDPTPGVLPADPSADPSNTATLVFDVVVDANVIDGTVISNQAFVTSIPGDIVDDPSDDPRTPTVDDPTRDVVGNLPLLFAAKDVVLLIDAGTPGVVDPGDSLRYTITVHNSGTVPATGVVLQDAVPTNTDYVADSTTLNGLAVADGAGGASPLAAGIPLSSGDLTPPLPGPGAGVISAGETAVVEFTLQVDASTPGGTIISNQAVVRTSELPDVLTDGDGDPGTGPEPTVVVVGDGQQLAITKEVVVVGGGAALPGSMLEYLVRVVNIAAVPAFGVVITDDLDVPVMGQLSYVNPSATLNGSPVGISVMGSIITADYSGSYGSLAPGDEAVLRFRAVLDGSLAIGTTVTNTGVVNWNTPPESESASVSIEVGGIPGVGILRGALWHDADFDDTQGATERPLSGWIVDLYRNGAPLQSAVADAGGAYAFGGVTPNDVNGDVYELRFRAPDAGANTAALGTAVSPFTNGLQQIGDIVVASGGIAEGLDLPIDPNGVVYGAVGRAPLAGAILSLSNANGGAALPASCFDDPAQQGQITGSGGYYKFDLNFSDPSCPSDASYLIALTPPGPAFVPGSSQIIPPTSDASTAALSVPGCPGTPDDAVPATAQHCESQPSELAPPASVPPRTAGTLYHLHLRLEGGAAPGSSQIFNNHIPVDPVLDGAVAITKTTPQINVSRGHLVPYEITFSNELGTDLLDLSIVDRFPAGFHYVEGSARIDGVPMEPIRNGRELVWNDVGVNATSRRSLMLLLAVGAGVTEGEFVNRAQAFSSLTGTLLSGEATATVRVVPDPTFDCTDVLGKVFDDGNRNGVQDAGERGLQGVRLVTARGLVATSDRHGRFHIACAVVPNEERGSNFVLKLDDRTLPSGYRMTTRQTQVLRATRGKALRFNFGASIQRVVGLDLADAVFEPGSTEMRAQWRPRLDLLLAELRKGPAILRLSYLADVEDEGLVSERLDAVKQEITEIWQTLDADALTIETEVFWRRGAPPERSTRVPSEDDSLASLPSVGAGPPVLEGSAGESAERHLSSDEGFTRWSQDPEALDVRSGDRLEQREVVAQKAKTVKLTNVVPPIRFASGVADIPASTIERLRVVLDGMRHLHNVRLHLVGHADDQPLSGALSGVYGDNEGLSRERAGEVAEFVQTALALPPEAISFAWAGEAQPIASNATAAGRAQNRRVEVEIWHDELEDELALQEVVVSEEIKRFKICRTETVCKLRYRDGHARRARVKNLIAPLHFDDEAVDVSEHFVRQVAAAFHNLRDRRNVRVEFIGYTDDVPLTGRAARIYGTHLAISKARAHRVALAIQDALDLPTSAVGSDGHGSTRPVASNATDRGRALNRRVEVEFWHDDPLQELPDEPQVCPNADDAEVVTKVYDPPWGRLEPLRIVDGEPVIPSGYADDLLRALSDVAERSHARLRFVGYTNNERLDRRTAAVYGDDIGLSAARARRTMEKIRAETGLSEAQAEHEGRGYVHSNDVVNAGFVQGETSHVVVQVVYDELAPLDDYEGVEITPITRELTPADPLALNLMRITVDGEPIDDPGRSLADLQRCTDVALERADIRFRFDNLESIPRLSVTAQPSSVPVRAAGSDAASAPTVRFRMYTNYPHFIERSEVRIFEQGRSEQATPLAVAPVGADGLAEWQPPVGSFESPVRELRYLLRAYDEQGRFDETSAQTLWLIHADASDPGPSAGDAEPESAEGAPESGADPLLAGYGESGPLARSIPLGSVGTVEVHGSGIPPGHSVWLAGTPVPVDEHGRFVAEAVLPAGMHTVEVAVLDPEGNGELFLRDLEFKTDDWFYVGIADLTFSDGDTGASDALTGGDAPYDRDSWADGRLAFYLKGKLGEDWGLTASADTREGPVEDLFDDFVDKSPDALFRRIDPDYHYPTFGDDGTVEETAPTSGKLYLKLTKEESHALWGNFKVGYLGNELGHVDRGLYGANVHYQSPSTTRFGEQRVVLDGFAADPGTVASREEFRGTGGSLYFLRRQDLLMGSERVRIELRDKDSGLVTGVVHLRPIEDYDVDYLQGRVLLAEPLAATVGDDLLVRSGGLSGEEAWLVVQYEYTPGFDELDALTYGGQGQVWFNDFVKLGATANRNEEDDTDSSLYAADLTLRKSADSWLKLQYGRSEGLVSTSLRSDDGGFAFQNTGDPGLEDAEANAYRADVSVGIAEFLSFGKGRLSAYLQQLDEGYSAPGQTALSDTALYGGALELPLTEKVELSAKVDWRIEDDGLETHAQEVDVVYEVIDGWSLSAGVRNELRRDDSPVVPVTQDEGERTDVVGQVAYDSGSRWRAYGFGQGTVSKSGNREDNGRYGLGGAYRISDRLSLDGEVSHGDLGLALKLGTNYQQSEHTRRYISYALDNERGQDGLHRRGGSLISGARTRLSDSASVYLEDKYQHSDASNGLTRSMGVSLSPTDRWSFGANWELGTLIDRQTHAETERRAGGAQLAYGFEEMHLSSGVEYRYDETEQPDGSWTDRTTWLFRNTLKYQVTPSARAVGKYNHSFSDSSLGDFYDGGYREAVLGLAYRPVEHDRLNALAKYTYFYNVPTTDQVVLENTPAQFIQKSHVASLDLSYDVTESWTLGGKYAYRLGQVSLDREDPDFFDNTAHLYILRSDLRILRNWEGTVEGRMLDLPDLDERRSGALLTIYRYLGDHFKVGVGYNFTDFSDDLTDLDYDHHGWFFNVIGTL